VYMIPHYGVFLEAVRALTEAYALYAFFAALVIYAGGERAVQLMYESPEFETEFQHTMFCGLWKWKHTKGEQVLRWHKQCCAQLMVIKPLCALAVACCEHFGDSAAPNMKALILIFAASGLLSMMLLMRTLLNVYLMTKPALHGMQAVKKFTIVKLLVFITITQGMVINLVVAGNGITPQPEETAAEAGARLVSVLGICEMLMFAFVFMMTFTYKDFSITSSSFTGEKDKEAEPKGQPAASKPDYAAVPTSNPTEQHDPVKGLPLSRTHSACDAMRDIFALWDYFTAPIEEFDSEPLLPQTP